MLCLPFLPGLGALPFHQGPGPGMQALIGCCHSHSDDTTLGCAGTAQGTLVPILVCARNAPAQSTDPRSNHPPVHDLSVL